MPIETYLLEEKIPEVTLDRNKLNNIYKDMLRINKMEKYIKTEYENKKVRGFCHLILGQEALYGILKAVCKDDLIISSYRCHGAAYAAGIGIKEIICENLGLHQGNCRGKGGSMHLYNDRFFGGHGIVGAQVPLGIGLAYAIKYKEYIKRLLQSKNVSQDVNVEESKISFIKCCTNHVCFTIYGDGASNQGQIYEAFNLAKIYNLPVVFIAENNKVGMHTPITNVAFDDCLYKRGYMIPGIRVSDYEIENLNSAVIFAREYAMSKGPIILQIDTNRECFYSLNDTYKSECEIVDKSKLCMHAIQALLNKQDQNKIEKCVHDEMNDIISNIIHTDYPDKEELYKNLYYDKNKE